MPSNSKSAMTPRMSGGVGHQQQLPLVANSGDILAPDLSDLEYEMQSSAGGGGGPGKHLSINVGPGSAWLGRRTIRFPGRS